MGIIIKNNDLTYLPDTQVYSRASAFSTPLDDTNRIFVPDLALEFSVVGCGDYRMPT